MTIRDTALTTQQKTNARSGFSANRYVAIHEETIQLQFQPSAVPSANTVASITYTTATTGSHTNVLIGQTVYITPTSDWQSDWTNRRNECLRTYARKDATSTALFIGQTSYVWTTGHYVTVVDNFHPQQKQYSISLAGVVSLDVDVTYRASLPRITGDSDIVAISTNGTSASVTITPTVTATAPSASISSYSWDEIEDGTLTTNVSTSSSITRTISLGSHWLYLTATDSNGNSNWFAFKVWVIPDDFTSVVNNATGNISITSRLDTGYEGAMQTVDGLTDIVDDARLIVLTDGYYANGGTFPTTTRIDFTGYIKEADTGLQSDERFSALASVDYRLTSVATEGNTSVNVQQFPLTKVETPEAWGEFSANITPDLMIWFVVSELSTLGNLAGLSFFSGIANYATDKYNTPDGDIVDVIGQISFIAAGVGSIQFHPTSNIEIVQSYVYGNSTIRSGAATVTTFTTDDIANPRVTRVRVTDVSQVEAGGFVYDESTPPRALRTLAPSTALPGASRDTINGVLLTKNSTFANAGDELGAFSIAHLLASNPATIIECDLLGGYRLHPTDKSAYQFDLPSGTFADDTLIDTDNTFILMDATINSDERGGDVLRCRFREVPPESTEYAQTTDFLPLETAFPIVPFDIGDFEIDYDDVYGEPTDGSPGFEWGDNPRGEIGVTRLRVPYTGIRYRTVRNSILGATYTFRVGGIGKLGFNDGNWCLIYNFETSENDFVISSAVIDEGEYISGVGFVSTFGNIGGVTSERLSIQRTFPFSISNATQISITYTIETTVDLSSSGIARSRILNSGALVDTQNLTHANTGGSVVEYTQFFDVTGDTWNQLQATFDNDTDNDSQAEYVFKSFKIEGTGTNPFSDGSLCGIGAATRYGDAFYDNIQDEGTRATYSSGDGLLVDGSSPTAPAYDTGNGGRYEFILTGTGNAFALQYNDPDNDFGGNRGIIDVEIIGENM